MVTKAKHEIGKNGRVVTSGAVISELNPGFWTALISPRYEKALGVPHLHRAFPHALKDRVVGNVTQSVRFGLIGTNAARLGHFATAENSFGAQEAVEAQI